ncbi:MAG: endonuclease/exonuclease/phosphatase (EEP) superfamily protein YafD [Algoriphagus sp.]
MHFLKDFVIKSYFLLNILVAIYALLVFQISYAADIKHWFAGFLTLTIPLAFAANIFFLISFIVIRSWKFTLSLLILVIGYPLLKRTLKFNTGGNTAEAKSAFSVLSYNAMYCNYANSRRDEGKLVVNALINDMDTLSADIKCFQEMYNMPGDKTFDVFNRLKMANPYYTYMHSEEDESSNTGAVGLATFSKFPIVNKKEISWKTNNNGILLTDLLVNADTIRVLNIQLKSMGIRLKKAITSNEEVRAKETRNILLQLKKGFEDRAIQVDLVEEFIHKSPYPVILVGDFNELPYGYAYGRMRKYLDNAFEEAGFGFGFTYHKMPSFLRIDNQFFDNNYFKILDFDTYKNLPNSDHYPIRGVYDQF